MVKWDVLHAVQCSVGLCLFTLTMAWLTASFGQLLPSIKQDFEVHYH
jgi:hypothetical protein